MRIAHPAPAGDVNAGLLNRAEFENNGNNADTQYIIDYDHGDPMIANGSAQLVELIKLSNGSAVDFQKKIQELPQ